MPSAQRATALDFVTHNNYGDKLSVEERDECVETIKELMDAFGPQRVILTMAELGGELDHSQTIQQTTHALRAFAVIVLSEKRPKLAAKLVGRLVGLDIATGTRESLGELGKSEGISKQAVSKKLAAFSLQLGIPRMESTERSRESAYLMNRRNYGS